MSVATAEPQVRVVVIDGHEVPLAREPHAYSGDCRCLSCADRRQAWRAQGKHLPEAPDWRGRREGVDPDERS
jgi:hypothetical protein